MILKNLKYNKFNSKKRNISIKIFKFIFFQNYNKFIIKNFINHSTNIFNF